MDDWLNLAESIRVATSMIGTHIPLHLLIGVVQMIVMVVIVFPIVMRLVLCSYITWCYLKRSSKPLSDRYLPRPIVFLCVLAEGKPVTVATAAVPKVTLPIVVAALRPPGYIACSGPSQYTACSGPSQYIACSGPSQFKIRKCLSPAKGPTSPVDWSSAWSKPRGRLSMRS